MPLSDALNLLPVHVRDLVESNEKIAVFKNGVLDREISTISPIETEISVPAGRTERLHFLFLHGSGENSETPVFQVTVGEGARVALTETHVAIDDGSFEHKTRSRIVVQKGAQLEHQRLSRLKGAGRLESSAEVKAYRDSQVTLTQLALGGGQVTNHTSAELLESGASAALLGLNLSKGKQHINNTTFVHHRVGHTQSRQLYKNVLAGDSRIDFNGRLLIDEDAQKSDASQFNHNLMLGEFAEANTTPQLEVFADDVKAAHGATVGQLDQDQIFYLMSRGLSRAQSVHFLAEGFLQDIVERMPEEQRAKGRALLSGAFHEFLEAEL